MATTYGVELLDNGNFAASTGIGAASGVGPGWTSSYAACGPNIFNTPCGASTYSFFTTNAGQVTANYVRAVPIPARGGRSLAVNVGPNTNIPIIQWQAVPLVNGRTYRFRCDAAVINFPFAVALKIDGALIGALAAPAVASVWTNTEFTFTWAGTTGAHDVGIFSNSGQAAGNDQAFDGFSLREAIDTPEDCCGRAPRMTALTGCYYPADGDPTLIRTVNSGFEQPSLHAGTPGATGPLPGNWYHVQQAVVPGWRTDDPTGEIEFWPSGAVDGVASYAGAQSVEINYVAATRLWQTLAAGVPDVTAVVHWEWAHRSRLGTGANRAQMLLGQTGDPLATHTIVSDDNAAANRGWQFFQGTWQKPAGVTSIDVSLRSITPAGGVGNLVDAVRLYINRRRAVCTYCCNAAGFVWRDAVNGAVIPAAEIDTTCGGSQ